MEEKEKIQEILKILEKDPRISPEEIGRLTDLPETEVEKHLSEAEHSGTILGYRTYVDWKNVGREEVHALVEVKITPQRGTGFQTMAERIARFPEVHSLYLISGDYDLSIHLVAANIYDVSSFISEKIAPLEGVQGTSTHFVMRRFKENGVLMIEGEDSPERLPIAP